MSMEYMDFHRGRRLRRSAGLRDLVREVVLTKADLIQPYFVVEGDPHFEKEVSSMPGQHQLGIESFLVRLDKACAKGLKSCILFGIPGDKDEVGSGAYAGDGIVQRAVRAAKRAFPELVVMTDVCLCEYTNHGHCGLIDAAGRVQNDPTLELLARTALSHAEAGADVVAPSDMMDGRVAAIREALDEAGFAETPILSYAVKYASAFYGPFRDAAQSAPAFGDRKTYQMDPGNRREALLEASADAAEGADMLMVKPAGAYLDVIRMVKDRFDLPLAAYQVSGEYAMIKAAAQNGWIDEARVAHESLLAIKRAGADVILSYFTESFLDKLP